MINDLLIYTHLPVAVPPGGIQNPDWQTVQDQMTVVNRTSTAGTVVNTVFGLVNCTMLTGGAGGSGWINQNLAADATLWLPTLPASEAIPDFTTLSPYQRMTFSYENVDPGGQVTYSNLQTAFIGHYPRFTTPDIELQRPFIYYTPPIEVPGGSTAAQYIHIQPSQDFLVHQFYAHTQALSVLVTIRDVASGRNLTADAVFADLIAYRNLSESQNFRQPFLPWVAPRDHRYRIEFTNIGQTQTVQFAFAGRLCLIH